MGVRKVFEKWFRRLRGSEGDQAALDRQGKKQNVDRPKAKQKEVAEQRDKAWQHTMETLGTAEPPAPPDTDNEWMEREQKKLDEDEKKKVLEEREDERT